MRIRNESVRIARLMPSSGPTAGGGGGGVPSSASARGGDASSARAALRARPVGADAERDPLERRARAHAWVGDARRAPASWRRRDSLRGEVGRGGVATRLSRRMGPCVVAGHHRIHQLLEVIDTDLSRQRTRLSHVARCMLHGVCCLLSAVCCMLRCLSRGVGRVVVCPMSDVLCHMSRVARCEPSARAVRSHARRSHPRPARLVWCACVCRASAHAHSCGGSAHRHVDVEGVQHLEVRSDPANCPSSSQNDR